MTQVGELNEGEVLQCGKRVFDGCWFWMPQQEGKGCHVLHTGIYIVSSPPLGHHHCFKLYRYTPHSIPTACSGLDREESTEQFRFSRRATDWSWKCNTSTLVQYNTRSAPD